MFFSVTLMLLERLLGLRISAFVTVRGRGSQLITGLQTYTGHPLLLWGRLQEIWHGLLVGSYQDYLTRLGIVSSLLCSSLVPSANHRPW